MFTDSDINNQMEKKEKTKNGLYEYFYEGDHSDQINGEENIKTA